MEGRTRPNMLANTITTYFGIWRKSKGCLLNDSVAGVICQTLKSINKHYFKPQLFYKKRWTQWSPSLWITCTYRVSQEECARLREGVPYVKVYRYNPKHLCPKLNGYGDNGQRSLKLWQLLHTYWLPNTY